MSTFVGLSSLVPEDGRRRGHVGYLSAGGSEFSVQILMSPEEDQHVNDTWLCINVDWRLRCLLDGCEDVLCQRLKHCKDLIGFVSEFNSLVEKLVLSSKRLDNPMDVAVHEEIASALSYIGWDKVKYVSDNFDTVQLMCYDAKQRLHVLTVRIPSQSTEPTFTADLPVLFRPEFLADRKSMLQQAFTQFQEKVILYADLWNVLDEIDEKTWVLEPEWPTRSSVMRRIAFGKSASVQIDLDPLHPRAIPEYRLLGPEQAIIPIKECIDCNLPFWDLDRSLLMNLQNLFGTNFATSAKDGNDPIQCDAECGICYSYRFEGNIPDKTCDNPHCFQLYHAVCLYEWLRYLPSCHQSFNTLFGECPYCNQQITIQMPS